MFENIGGKIKGLAKFYCYTGIILSVLSGFAMIATMEDEMGIVIGIVIAGVGALVSWVSSFLLYGFGELVDSTEAIYYMIRKNTSDAPYSVPGNAHHSVPGSVSYSVPHTWKCTRCGQENGSDSMYCVTCGNPHI